MKEMNFYEKEFYKIANATTEEIEGILWNHEWAYVSHPEENIEETIDKMNLTYIKTYILNCPKTIEKIKQARQNVWNKWLEMDI